MVSSFKRDRRKSSSQQSKKPTSSSQPVASVPAVSRLAMGSSRRQSIIQTKLKVNQSGDRYEQEADAVARAVVQSKAGPLPQPDSGRDLIQRMPEGETVQRMADEGIANAPMVQSDAEEDTIQRKGTGTPTVSGTTAALIRNPGAGSPLPNSIRKRVEPHVRANLSGVRLHTDSSAQQATTSLNARAFTHRNHIFLNRSESSGNLGLMAHELTHTVQQGAVPRTSVAVSSQPDQEAPASASSQPKEPAQPQPKLASTLSSEKRLQPFQTVSAPPETKETAAEAKRANAIFASTPAKEIDEKDKAPRSPATDPAFQAVTQRSKRIAKQQQKHAPAKAEAASAQAAAVSPAGELKSQAQDQQMQSLDQQKPGTFSADKFVELLMKKVTAVVPKDEKSALDPNRQSKIETVKKTVSTAVTQEKDRASSAIAQKTQEKPSTQGLKPRIAKPLTTTKAGPKPTNLKASQAAPKAKTHIEVTQPLEHNNAQLQQQMTAANITDEQLANANEPQFTEALTAKKELQTQTKKGPKAYREIENKLLTQAGSEAQVTGQKQTSAMHAERKKLLAQAKSQQVAAKSKDEQARAKVVKDINGIYESTKSSVTTILSGLDKEVSKRFDSAAKVADTKFKDVVDRGTKAFREKRYGSWYNVFGYGNRLIDLIGKLPPQLNAVYVRAREFYVTTMRDSIKEIGAYVAQQLNAAKQKIADGKKAITTYVNGLSPTLKQVGETAASNIQEKFTQLGEQVNSKQGQLVDSLAQKYAKNLKGVEAHLNKLREENSGLIAKAAKYAKGVWKIIQNLRKMLLSVLAKASATIDAILNNPIGFVKLLIKGVKQGFSNFVANIVKHFQSGLIGWLTGALGPMGIEIPKDIFSLKGIFSLVTQVLGLTWDFVRRKAVKLFGEKTVSAMEKSVEIIQILRKDGVAELWKHLKDQFSDLKSSVMDQIKDLLMVQVLQAGVKWILGLLNPASAFVKAAMLIYDIVMFFVNQGSQMVELVKAVVDGISAIASGKVGAIAKAVEGALVRSVPLLIGFLAALLGIGGLAKKIQEIVERIRKRIEIAISKLLLKIQKMFNRRKNFKNKQLDSLTIKVKKISQKVWGIAYRLTQKRAFKKPDLLNHLNKDRYSQKGISIKIFLKQKDSNWYVEVLAIKKSKKIVAAHGRGWINKSQKGELFYIGRDLKEINKKLINEAFLTLKRRGENDNIKEAYKRKKEVSNKIQKDFQNKLEKEASGLKFSLEIERFSEVEKDNKLKAKFLITPNTQERTEDIEIGKSTFQKLFKIEAPNSDTHIEIETRSKIYLRRIKKPPMLGKSTLPGYVVNMPAIPKEVKKTMVTRYFSAAWKNGRTDISKMRTAVILGINSFKSIDPDKENKVRGEIRNAIRIVDTPSDALVAVFGFIWEPRWRNLMEKRSVPVEAVRREWNKLDKNEKEKVLKDIETSRVLQKLPYGVFRNQVIESQYTKKSVNILSRINDPIHVLTQDADGGVKAKVTGVLAAYDNFLIKIERHPLMTIGGYRFSGFDWGELGNSHTQQLTELANAVDRAIRNAISEVYPEMLYPTEPNLLIKAKDRKNRDGIFDNGRKPKNLFGFGATEGGTVKRKTLEAQEGMGKRKHDKPIAYAPEASSVTSPVPNSQERGLTVRPGEVNHRNRYESISKQKQSAASSGVLSREFQAVAKVSKGARGSINKIFAQVEKVGKSILNPESNEFDNQDFEELYKITQDKKIFNISEKDTEGKKAEKVKDRESLKKAYEITQKIIQVMNSEELLPIWTELKNVFDDIERHSKKNKR